MSASGESQHTSASQDGTAAPSTPDYYAILDLPPDANYDDIRRAFHAGAKQWHPDRFMAASDDERAEAERQMRALIEAHAVLSDPARRALYDHQRNGASRPGHKSSTDTPDSTGYTSWHTAAADPEAYDRLYSNNDPSGVANFLGVLLGTVALGILWTVLRGATGIASYAGLALAILIGGCALWCIADPAGLGRAAERLAARSPSPSAANQQRSHAATRQHAEDTAEPPSQDGAEPPDFERLVDEAVAAIPDEFQPYLRNVAVRVRPEPTAAERRRMRLRERETLFGLYEGVMLTNQGAAGAGPEIITIFQRPIERACEGDPARMREQVRRTVLHELAHHFGLDHDEMPDWIK